MTVIDLNKENIASYVKSRIDFFDQDADLSVYEIGESGEGSEDGDGFINFIYRVWDNKTGRSVIVKQAKSHAKYFSEKQTNFVRERNEMEASLMRLRASITRLSAIFRCRHSQSAGRWTVRVYFGIRRKTHELLPISIFIRGA